MRRLHDLKRLVSGKNSEKYNAVQTQFDHFLFWNDSMGQTVLSMIEVCSLKVFQVIKGYRPEWKLDRFLWLTKNASNCIVPWSQSAKNIGKCNLGQTISVFDNIGQIVFFLI